MILSAESPRTLLTMLAPAPGFCEGDQISMTPFFQWAVVFCGSRLAWEMKG